MPIILDGTNGETFPSWTTAGRPSPVAPGQTGYNTTLNVLETYNGTSWEVSSVPAPTTTGNVLFTTNGTNWSSTPKITSGTVNAGGTNPFPGAGGPVLVDFTSIPSWVKRITVMLNGVSTNGTSNIQAQIGAGSITSTGYKSASIINNNANITGLNIYTTGFGMDGGSPTATTVRYGVMTIVSMGSNVWAYTYNGYMETYAFAGTASGTVTLSGTLDRVRITTVNGTDTFDAGSINILYE